MLTTGDPGTTERAQPAEAWHGLAVDAVLSCLEARRDGLSTAEAQSRLSRYGSNRLTPPRAQPLWLRFLRQFHNVLIYVLLAAALVTGLLQHWVDTGVILGVVVINGLIGFIQEGKAERALEAIRGMLSHQASVMRDGAVGTIPAEQLVLGDIVLLQSGDRVPADLRLVRVRELRIDESILTGESVPSEKSTDPVAANAEIGDRESMAYSGTLITYGQGTGVVIATADATELGRISALLRRVQTLTTPLLRQIGRFARWLSLAILVIAAFAMAFGILVHGYPADAMFLAAVGLAVAAIPEGLPAIMTITLAIGVQRMAARNAIIRRLPAVETLGSVTVICSDKTGTLTKNEMTARGILTATETVEISGTGYDPHGGFLREERAVDPSAVAELREIARAALLCNDARVSQQGEHWVLHGDPTEGALVTLGLKAGLDPHFEHREWPRTDVIPFESQHRYMATLHHDHAGHAFVYVKGAPERVLEMCRTQRARGEDIPLDIAYWERGMHELAGRGQRLIAIASRAVEPQCQALDFKQLEGSLSLLGVIGIIDPPRDEAVRAVTQCHEAGIQVKMITGDHARTAGAIAEQMGLTDGEAQLTGREIESLDEARLADAVERLDVFARTSPEHKLRLVTALQSRGHVVAMTGDGVNDAPALRRADVGIAMGHKGSEVAREAAEMVLVDDNFASITSAIEEGRTVYDNLKKAILFILPTNGGEALIVLLAILLGHALPITPAQILWVNMITAVTLALALAFEPGEPGVMQRRPRDPAEPLLSRLLLWRIGMVSLILVAGSYGLFLWERSQGADLALARTVAVNTLVAFEVFYLFNSRYILAPALNREGLLGNRYALLAIALLVLFQLGFTYLPPAQALFATVPLSGETWLRIVLVASSVLFLVELEKAVLRYVVRRRETRAAQDPPPSGSPDRPIGSA